jgi:hypothetical protein
VISAISIKLTIYSRKNLFFSTIGNFIVETFRKISFINFTKLQYAEKDISFQSSILQELMTTCFENIPYFELVEGLLDEISILNGQKNEILSEFDD